ncbi:MAG: histidinol-phosphate transaminase [Flavobacteriaceae bacterium]
MKKDFDINQLVRENLKTLKPYSSARDEFKDAGNTSYVFLDANENPFENGVNRYPDPQQRNLKAKLADLKGMSTSNLLLGNGSDEVLDLLFRAFCEPNRDNIITMPPTYGMYGVLAGINAVENRKVPLDANFQPNVDEILKQTDPKTRLIFLCSPNNPTGNSFSADSISSLLDAFDGLVIIDEAYIDFSDKQSWIGRLAEYPNLVVTQTLSKAYGMAGIRLGLCFASEAIIGILNKIKPPYNVNQLTQTRAFERITKGALITSEIKNILSERRLLREALSSISFVKTVFNSDANFVLVRVDNADLRYDQLIEKGIVVRNRSKQQLCENTLRFTVGTPEENQKLIATLKDLEP